MSADTAPLGGLRVLEVGAGAGLAYAGRLLADCGADVVKIPIGQSVVDGDPAVAALAGDYLDGGKRVVPQQDLAAGVTLAERLGAGRDVVLTSLTAADWEQVGGSPARLAGGGTAAVVDLTPFGLTGAYRFFRGDTELMVACLSGFAYGTPNSVADLDATPPRSSGGLDAELVGGALAALAGICGWTLARDDGAVHVADVAMLDAMVAFGRLNVAQWTYARVIPSRSAQGLVLRAPTGFLRCSDGFVNIHCANDEQWRRLVRVMGTPDWADNELFATGESRAMFWDALKPLMSDWFAARSKLEVTDLLQAERIVCFPEQTMADLLADRQLAARDWFRSVAGPHGPIPVPGPGFRLESMPTPEVLRPERASIESVSAEPAGTSRPARLAGHGHGAAGPLRPVRVIDLSTVIGGPLATQVLGQLGAEVIKIESRTHPDLTRTSGPYPTGHTGPEASGYYHGLNAAKDSVVLEVATPPGRALLDELLAGADVLVENYSRSAARKLGIDPAEILARHPHLVYLSQTGLGATGPHRDYVTYGPQLMARAGWNTVMGATDAAGEPLSGGGQLTDQLSGVHEALAIIAALVQRGRTGRGQYVDVSMLECQVPTVAVELVRHGLGAAAPGRPGVRGVLRCAGEDRWLAVDASGPDEIAALAAVLEVAEADPDTVRAALATWLRERDPDEAMTVLQARGVGAARVSNAADVAGDGHLADRHVLVEHDRGGYGPLRLPDLPIVLDGRRAFDPRPAPVLGEHTDAVLGGLLRRTG
ncbi:MAG TPA: CoA transferase [Mycobacteriales bacterium]|nr:CoA transferase [Mycobacteriales bacterium]